MYATPDAAACPQSSEFFRRTLIVLSSASLLISLVVYFLHEWYHTDLVEFLGISHRMADTLGTLGIFRAYLTYFANGGAITLDNAVSDVYSPVYYGSVLGLPIPIWVFLLTALIGGLVLNRTRYGRYVQAIGSNEQVARYAAVEVDRIGRALFG